MCFIMDSLLVKEGGCKNPKMMTQGWDILVEWKHGTSSWVPLKDLKASNPVNLAEYEKANRLAS